MAHGSESVLPVHLVQGCTLDHLQLRKDGVTLSFCLVAVQAGQRGEHRLVVQPGRTAHAADPPLGGNRHERTVCVFVLGPNFYDLVRVVRRLQPPDCQFLGIGRLLVDGPPDVTQFFVRVPSRVSL